MFWFLKKKHNLLIDVMLKVDKENLTLESLVKMIIVTVDQPVLTVSYNDPVTEHKHLVEGR